MKIAADPTPGLSEKPAIVNKGRGSLEIKRQNLL